MKTAGRFVVALWLVTAVLVATIAWLGLAIVERLRADALSQEGTRLFQAVASAESVVNRTLLSIDVLLTGLPELVSIQDGPGEHERTRKQLAAVVSGNLLLRDIVLARPDGTVIAAGLETSERLGLSLPAGFLARVNGKRPVGISISDPVESFEYAEGVAFVARPFRRDDDQAVIAIAVVPMAQIDSALAGVDTAQAESMALERDDGRRLASVPPAPPTPERAAAVRTSPRSSDGRVQMLDASGDEAQSLVASRALLYPELLVVGSVPVSSALARWRGDRFRVLLLATALSLAIVGAAWAATKYIANLAAARRETIRATDWLNQAMASIPEGILLCDAGDRVMAWNQAYLEHFPMLEPVLRKGMPFEHLVRFVATRLLPDASEAERLTWVDARLRRHHSPRAEFEELWGEGKRVRITENVTPAGGVVSVCRDVTATELELARARLSEEAAAISKLDYLSAVTDAAVNPTNAILGNLELLLAQEATAKQRRYLTSCLDLGHRILSTIDGMFEAAKLATGAVKLAFTKFDPLVLVDEATSALHDLMMTRAVDIRIASGHSAALWGDAARLKTALISLLRTEVEYISSGELAIDIAIQPEAGGRSRLAIDVCETGMTARARNELVSQMQRARAVEPPSGARSPGLHLARAIAQAMQGELSVLRHSSTSHTVRVEVIVDSINVDATDDLAQAGDQGIHVAG